MSDTPDITYLLDTSALRGLGRQTLNTAIEAGIDLAISPISVWELLCHVDEPDENGIYDFMRSKGRLAKARLCRLLDDPVAEHARFVGVSGITHPTRFDDRLLIPQLLEHLDQSTSLEEFYSRKVEHPSGEFGEIRDCAKRAREVLDEEEQRHSAKVRHYQTMIEEKIGFDRLKKMTDEEFLSIAMSGSVRLGELYKQGLGTVDELMEARIFVSTGSFLGYVLARTKEYMLKAEKGARLTIDPNDTEDAFICLHLNLLEPRTLVTDDKATLRCMSETLARLSEALQEKGISEKLLARAIDCNAFRAELGL